MPINFSILEDKKAAVLMPDNPTAREQVEFLHTVEINRGRGVINYVETFDEAFSRFEEMAKRA